MRSSRRSRPSYVSSDWLERKDNIVWDNLNVSSGTELENNKKKCKRYKDFWTDKMKNKFVSEKSMKELENDNFHMLAHIINKNKRTAHPGRYE